MTNDSNTTSSTVSSDTAQSSEPVMSKENAALAALFVGKSKQGSQDLAEARNLVWRPISVDGEPFFSYPDEIRNDRVCVELMNGKVVKATIR